ncbi:MAG: prephenate dehydrogenase/arogenate dehydrogenase family protein [Planctomycetales bacterium]|nr:prephenate dehydrogenase/arogenate dehydrogenase family protein [Planctomycetales bacterium]
MPLFDRVAIVGVGLIGGSVGLALRERGLAGEVVGVGRRQASVDRALAVEAVDHGTTRFVEGVSDADMVIVATPVAGIVDVIRSAAFFAPKAALTDAGSTKAEICRELREPISPDMPQLRPGPSRFIGSHPLAGDHRTGPEFARADLFVGRTVVVTPEDDTAPGLVDKVTSLWESLGAEVVLLAPEDHDRAIASTSHLPHLVAAALASATPEDWLQLAATGWSDTTRVAAGDVELWTQIFSQNRAAVLEALRRFEHRLAALATAIETDDRPTLAEQLQDAKRIRDALGD